MVLSPSVSEKTVSVGETFTFTATVHNQGNGPSKPVVVYFLRSTTWNTRTTLTLTTELDKQIAAVDIEGIPVGGSVEVSSTLSTPLFEDTEFYYGDWYYGACVGSAFRELSTVNNCSPVVVVTITE